MPEKAPRGRKPLPHDEQLVSHGFHIRRHRVRLMQAVAQVTGEAQRGLFERLLDKEAERLRRQGVELDRALAKIVKAEQA